jgi:hypothetical protein
VDDFVFGIQEIKSFREQQLIEIGNGTLAYGQLSCIQEQDLTDFPEIRFFAINALRHVVASFFKSPACGPMIYKRKRHGPIQQ